MRQFICAAFLLFGICFSSFSQTIDEYLITSNSVGPVRLGMTLAQARQVIGQKRIEMGTGECGDYGPCVTVFDGKYRAMYLYFVDKRQNDKQPPVNESSIIFSIAVHSPEYKTLEGIRKGMLVSKVQKLIGKPVDIYRNLMGDEYVLFDGLSDNYFLETMGGIYKNSETTGVPDKADRYRPNSKILSITIRAVELRR
jgi:hypothetical protein